MTTMTALELPELWMELKDPTLLKELMQENGISARQLSRVAGWRSHSYMNRLLAGQAKNLDAEPAARIAHQFKVPFNLLFRTRVSGDRGQTARRAREVVRQ